MQVSRLRRPSISSRQKRRAVVPSSGNTEPAPLDGTIASACALGIRLEDFIQMTRLARGNDEPAVAQFL